MIARRLIRHPTGRIGLVLTLAVIAFATLGPFVAPDPNAIDVPNKFLSPNLAHPLGTDNLGRDLFARAAVGTRFAVLVALAVVALSGAVGALIGTVAGLAGGWIDRAVTVLFDIVSAYPPVILALGLVALYGSGNLMLMLVVAVLFVPQFGRMARAQTLSLRDQPFVDAERILGIGTPRLIFRHLLPNVAGPMIVLASMNIPVVITVEAGLSFLGLGVKPPQASLGSLIKDGYIYLDQSWWPTIGAAVILALATLGATLLGEALRDVTDPKLRGRG
jgi:peptide/nickel transport system permease protein